MKQLIEAYNDALKAPNLIAGQIRQEFAKLDIRGKLTLLCQGQASEVYDDILHEDNNYTGTDGSLYDDFYWDRHETKTLSTVVEMTIDNMDIDGDETPEELADLILQGQKAESRTVRDRCAVVVDMANRCIGTATHDW